MTNNLWQIKESDYPQSGIIVEKIRFWLRYAVLAPSAHNTQPWRVEINGDQASIYRDPDYTLQESDGTLRETFLGLGAFLENLIVAAAHWHYQVTISQLAFTTADLLIARLRFSPIAADTEQGLLSTTSKVMTDPDLFNGITKRHTNRGHYVTTSLSEDTLKALKVAIEPDLLAVYITDSQAKERIARLVGQATQMALSVNTMKRELADLTFRESEQRPVGMMVEALTETPPEATSGADWTLHHMNAAEHGQYWHDTFASSPVQVLIGTRYDGPEAWLAAGRLMERILLKAAALGFTHCISAGPIEVPTLLPELRKEMAADYRPQALFRLGVPVNPSFTRYSTRRSVDLVVTGP